MSQQTLSCRECRRRQALLDELRRRNTRVNSRCRFLAAQFKREHARRLAAEQQIRELEQRLGFDAARETLPALATLVGALKPAAGKQSAARKGASQKKAPRRSVSVR